MYEDPHTLTCKRGFPFALLALIASALAMIAVAAACYPPYFAQPRALVFLIEPVCALAVYGVAVILVVRAQGSFWHTIRNSAALFGLLSGCLEIVNLCIENGLPLRVSGQALQIVIMLLLFALWAIAGAQAARTLDSLRGGVWAALVSAGLCMLLGVAAGFLIELFLIPPSPASIATWGEFQRSGWTDARAFGIANTFDSGFTHLAEAPVVAVVFGGLASLLVRLLPRRPLPGVT